MSRERMSEGDWKPKKPRAIKLRSEGVTFPDILRDICDEDFSPSERQLRRAFKRWARRGELTQRATDETRSTHHSEDVKNFDSATKDPGLSDDNLETPSDKFGLLYEEYHLSFGDVNLANKGPNMITKSFDNIQMINFNNSNANCNKDFTGIYTITNDLESYSNIALSDRAALRNIDTKAINFPLSPAVISNHFERPQADQESSFYSAELNGNLFEFVDFDGGKSSERA